MLLSVHYNATGTFRTKESTQLHKSLKHYSSPTATSLAHHQAALSCTDQLHDGSVRWQLDCRNIETVMELSAVGGGGGVRTATVEQKDGSLQ